MDIPSLMAPEFMGEGGMYLIDYTNRMNDYGGRNLQSSAYLAADLPFGRIRLYGGLRYEHTYTILTLNQSRTEARPVDFRYLYGHVFPSLNITYSLSEKKQLRASYGRSINRPEFRELSTSVYYDLTLVQT
jgi:outer membrane receptor protein involved in Fe transport